MLSPPSDVAIRIMIFNWLRQRFSLVSSVVTAESYSPIMWALVAAEYCSQQTLFFSITGRLQQNLRDNVESNDCHYTFRLISNSLWYLCVRGNETIYKPAFPNHLQNYACRNTSSPFYSYVNQTFTQQQFLKQAFYIILVNILLNVPHGTLQHKKCSSQALSCNTYYCQILSTYFQVLLYIPVMLGSEHDKCIKHML